MEEKELVGDDGVLLATLSSGRLHSLKGSGVREGIKDAFPSYRCTKLYFHITTINSPHLLESTIYLFKLFHHFLKLHKHWGGINIIYIK